ncbi:MAG: prepilin peptidase [Methylotenera sp.]|nr:prepilin peptidase [Methylotenera sp.]MDP2281997.1 prepilin peptidase [Methylotenera sp.]MDP3060993.1 prepilin peptidase [Methylotenera sp.]
MLGWLALLPLLGLLLAITRHDIRSRRIPNKLVLMGVLIGVALNGLLPTGTGFNSAVPGGLGWLVALQGLGVGMAVFLPIYWLRAMGAGDVKLMGMVGAFLGPTDILGVVLATFIAGGIMALVVVIRSRQLSGLLRNVRLMLTGGMVNMSAGRLPLMNDLPVSVGKLPYAVAITVGTLAYLVW